jgi:small multidrug resistance family-3 protein
MMAVTKTVGLFIVAAVCEIGGAYLIWQWRNGGKPAWFVLAGGAALFLYGFMQTAQTFNFGRAFAAYGGVFTPAPDAGAGVAAATLWGWWVDGRAPDHWDWIGAGVSLAGAALIVWGPRG